MATKSQFVAFRAEPHQQHKLRTLARMIGEGSNTSAALRWLVDNAPEPTAEQVLAGQQPEIHGEVMAHG